MAPQIKWYGLAYKKRCYGLVSVGAGIASFEKALDPHTHAWQWQAHACVASRLPRAEQTWVARVLRGARNRSIFLDIVPVRQTAPDCRTCDLVPDQRGNVYRNLLKKVKPEVTGPLPPRKQLQYFVGLCVDESA
jgi:hypothetical protein